MRTHTGEKPFVCTSTTDPVVQQMGKDEHGTVCKGSFYNTNSLTHRVRQVQSKKTDLDNEQEQEVAVIRVTDKIDVNTAVTMKTGVTKHCSVYSPTLWSLS